jgi:2-polyprenyl-3-methyl-5-hydroxy-6-metoxy-1,4-benzoquinol methylase
MIIKKQLNLLVKSMSDISKKSRCALCGSDDCSIVCREVAPKRGEMKKIDNVICNRCGLIYNNPMLTDEYLDNYYKNEFVKEQKEIENFDEFILEIKDKKSESTDKLVDFVKEFINDESEVLDIGCGFGKLLFEIKRKVSCRVTGIEPDLTTAKNSDSNYLIKDINNCSFDSFFESNNKKFDLVILKMVLEHLNDPNRYIENFKKILKPKGRLFIVVPNAYKFRPSKKLVDNFLFGHVFSYTPWTMHQMLLKHNLKIVKFEDNHVFSDLKIIATDVSNQVNAEEVKKLREGFDIARLKFRLKYHSFIYFYYKVKRKILSFLR